MATLIPEDLDLDGLHPESERRVIRELLLRLGDDWQIVPKVEFYAHFNDPANPHR